MYTITGDILAGIILLFSLTCILKLSTAWLSFITLVDRGSVCPVYVKSLID